VISKEQVEIAQEKVLELEKLLNPILDDLNIPLKDYSNKWSYAYDRRIKACTELYVTKENLKSSLSWYLAQGLVNIDVKE